MKAAFPLPARLIAVAIFLIGLGHIALLPVFEGSDEVGHFSSIEQIAETGTVPTFGKSYVSGVAVKYRQYGPLPRTTVMQEENGALIFNKTETMNYQKFFASKSLTYNYVLTYHGASPVKHSDPINKNLNWEAQHPPLYYLLMALVMKATDGISLVDQFFALRLFSFMLAFSGLLIGLQATLICFKDEKLPATYIRAGYLLYPFFFPVFFQTFGRLNNDTLCLYLMGVGWGLILFAIRNGFTPKRAIFIGAIFGLGLLTKGVFIPILIGYLLFLAARIIFAEKISGKARVQRAAIAALVPIVACLIGATWYLRLLWTTGSFVGNFSLIALNQHGGFAAGLKENFSVTKLLDAINYVFTSFSWFRTSSGAQMPELELPLLILLIWIAFAYAREILKRPLLSAPWLPLWLLVPMAGGLFWYLIQVMAFGEPSLVVAWYMHILIPALAFALGYALRHVIGQPLEKLLFGALAAYAFIFMIAAFWVETAVFGGCATVKQGVYQFAGKAYCLSQFGTITSNLSILAQPTLAAAAFVGAAGCLALAGYKYMKNKHI